MGRRVRSCTRSRTTWAQSTTAAQAANVHHKDWNRRRRMRACARACACEAQFGLGGPLACTCMHVQGHAARLVACLMFCCFAPRLARRCPDYPKLFGSWPTVDGKEYTYSNDGCVPGNWETQGGYIMYPRSEDKATAANYWKFSSCSTRAISKTLSSQGSCLTVPDPCAGDGDGKACCENGVLRAAGSECRASDIMEPCRTKAYCSGPPAHDTRLRGPLCGCACIAFDHQWCATRARGNDGCCGPVPFKHLWGAQVNMPSAPKTRPLRTRRPAWLRALKAGARGNASAAPVAPFTATRAPATALPAHTNR